MKFQRPIYLDYHATTPVDASVLEDMMPFFSDEFGNPASRSHPYGWRASEAVELARQNVADLISSEKSEIHFTSGSTEGLNMAIKGLKENLSAKGNHIVTIATEHPAVLDTLQWLSKKGFIVTKLPVDTMGLINLQQLEDSVRTDTIMVLVMWANNETGVLQNVKQVGEICLRKNTAFICDATQAVGKIPVDPKSNGIDIMVLSAHKMYGPKGTGAIFISQNEKKLRPEALIHGGGHEDGYRSGTLNVPGIVGLGTAARICKSNMKDEMVKIKGLRDRFEDQVINSVEQAKVNGSRENRLPSVSNLMVPFVDSQAVMTKLRTKLSISSGSACSSAKPEPSHVLLAMGLTSDEAKASFRISFGRPTTLEEVDLVSEMLIAAINDYRSESPVWEMFKKGIDVTNQSG